MITNLQSAGPFSLTARFPELGGSSNLELSAKVSLGEMQWP